MNVALLLKASSRGHIVGSNRVNARSHSLDCLLHYSIMRTWRILTVEKGRGLFHFGPEIERDKTMDEFCYEVVAEHYVVGINGGICAFTQGNGNTAEALAERAAMDGEIEHLFIEEGLNEARTKSLGNGMGIHYAGMLRHDRKLSEQMFSDGAMCAMLYSNSWGINLMVGNMHD